MEQLRTYTIPINQDGKIMVSVKNHWSQAIELDTSAMSFDSINDAFNVISDGTRFVFVAGKLTRIDIL